MAQQEPRNSLVNLLFAFVAHHLAEELIGGQFSRGVISVDGAARSVGRGRVLRGYYRLFGRNKGSFWIIVGRVHSEELIHIHLVILSRRLQAILAWRGLLKLRLLLLDG